MSNPDPDLEARVQALERKARRATLAAGGLGSALAVLLLLGARQQPEPPVHDVLRARSIEVVGAREDGGEDYVALRLGASARGGYLEAEAASSAAPDPASTRVEASGVWISARDGRGSILSADVFQVAQCMKVDERGAVFIRGKLFCDEGISIAGEEGEILLDSEGMSVFRGSALAGDHELALWLGRMGDGASVRLRGRNEAASLTLLPEALYLSRGAEMETILAMGPTATGDGQLSLYSRSGQDLVNLRADTDKQGGLIQVKNLAGHLVGAMRVDESGAGEVGAWDRNGQGQVLTPGK
jgi:hypothetical protein